MNRLVKVSFILLKVAALGLILVYLAAVVTVGAAGHSVGDHISFFLIFTYAVVLVLLLIKFKKRAHDATRKLLLMMLIPVVAVLLYFMVMILYDLLTGKAGLVIVKAFIAFIFILFVASGIVVIRALIIWKTDKKNS